MGKIVSQLVAIYAKLATSRIIYTPGIITFNLPINAKTTLQAVDKGTGVLIKNIWANEYKSAGPVGIIWDGKDEYDNTVSNKYIDFVLTYNNVTYSWEGVIGNTSSVNTGNGVHKNVYTCMTGMTVVGDYAYFCKGYAEQSKAIGKFALSDPQTNIYLPGVGGGNDLGYTTIYTDHVCNDGVNIYWGGNQCVYATKAADDNNYIFSSGAPFTSYSGAYYPSVIDYLPASGDNGTTGIAVQQSGNKLFVSHGYLNKIHVFNKTTGELLQQLSFTNPRYLCVDSDDNLWVVSGTNTVTKHTVNSDGTLSSATITLSGLTEPHAIQSFGTNIYVEDGGVVQKIYTYNTTTGTLNHTKGSGTYFADATVTNDKFYFSNVRDAAVRATNYKISNRNFIAFAPDGSMWINDPGNFRVQHYDDEYNYLETVMSMPASYTVSVDKSHTNRVWGEYLEFAIDYSQPVTGSTGWSLVKNWGANVDATYDDFQKFKNIITFTYSGVSRTFGLANKDGQELVELKSDNTIRFSGIKLTNLDGIDKSGNLMRPVTYPYAKLNKYNFMGFDGSDNPIWSSTPQLQYDLTEISTPDPALNSIQSDFTTSNKFPIYNPSVFIDGIQNDDPGNVYPGYHLGAVEKGGSSIIWKNQLTDNRSYNGIFPSPEVFEVGNGVSNYAGTAIMVVGNNIISGYRGEFWKGSQASIFNHYWENGAVIGQFGGTGPKYMEAQPRMAGSVITPNFVQGETSDIAYVWHGDESYHGGVHKWKITGLNSIASLTKSLFYTTNMFLPPVKPGRSIMSSVVYNQIYNGPSTIGNIIIPSGVTAQSNYANYDRKLPDLYVAYSSADETASGLKKVLFDLGSNSGSWKITGKFIYNPGFELGGNMQQYLDVLDNAGKIIIRLTNTYNYASGNPTVTLYVNGQELLTGLLTSVKEIVSYSQNLELGTNGSNVYLKLGAYTVTTTKFDAAANISQPKTFQPSFQGGFNPTGRSMAFTGMRIIN